MKVLLRNPGKKMAYSEIFKKSDTGTFSQPMAHISPCAYMCMTHGAPFSACGINLF